MGIEAIGSAVGRAASVAPAIGRIPSLEGGFSVRSIANPFKGAETGRFPLNRDGSSYIENRGPSLLEPTIGVIRNPEAKAPPQTISVAKPDLPSGSEAVDIAEQWLSVARQSTKNRSRDQVARLGFVDRQPTTRSTAPHFLVASDFATPILAFSEPKIQPKAGQIEFSKIAPRGAVLTELNKKSVQEDAVGQNLTEEILVTKKIDEKPPVLETEEVEESKLKDVLDEETAQQRVYEISEAIDLAQAEASKEGVEEIDGSRILKFLRLHIGLISQIARKIRKDGSLDETLEEIKARRFSSKDQAKEQTKETVARLEPVKKGKEGKTVREGAVERVLKHHFVKRSPVEEVDKRVVKKLIQTGSRKEPVQIQHGVVETKEPRIEDNADLAAVFLRKAA